jgi:hypothetical protein
MRMRNITRTGFEIRLQECEYVGGSGVYLPETVSYLAMERRHPGHGYAGRSRALERRRDLGDEICLRDFPVWLSGVTSAPDGDDQWQRSQRRDEAA